MSAPAEEKPATEQKAGLPTLHHLNNSQSQRILWLLEELGIEYNLVCYARNTKTQRAPPEMEKIHPLGKAPTLVTADGRVIVETTAIAGYLIRTYDNGGKHSSSDIVRDETLTAFSGSTLGVVVTFALMFDLMSTKSPWPLSYIGKMIDKAAKKNFLDAEFKKALTFLETELGEEDYFNGSAPGRPDVLLTFPIEQIALKKWFNLETDYPRLAAWRTRVLESPAWKRSLEKGNGYDLNF